MPSESRSCDSHPSLISDNEDSSSPSKKSKMRLGITMMVMMTLAGMRMMRMMRWVVLEKESAARTCSNKQNWHLLGHTVSPLFTRHRHDHDHDHHEQPNLGVQQNHHYYICLLIV